MSTKETDTDDAKADALAASKIAESIMDILDSIPATKVRKSAEAELHAEGFMAAAAGRASMLTWAQDVPPMALGWLIHTEALMAVWKLQAQLVADIAGMYGKAAELTREQMLYCLFNHMAIPSVQAMAVRTSGRVRIKQASDADIEDAARDVGVCISKRVISEKVTKLVPMPNSMSMFAHYDTDQAGKTAVGLFAVDIESVS